MVISGAMEIKDNQVLLVNLELARMWVSLEPMVLMEILELVDNTAAL